MTHSEQIQHQAGPAGADRPLKIALFSETFLPKLDGVVTVMCLLMDHLKMHGIEVMMFAPGPHVESYQGYPVVSIVPSVPMPMYPEARLSIPRQGTFKILKEFDPDLIHIANPWWAGVRFIFFAKRLNKPLVMSFHTHLMEMARFYKLGFLQKPLWSIHRWMYKKADYRVATSKRIVRELEEHGLGKTGLWRRGVDAKVFSPEFYDNEMRNRLTNGQPEKTLLLFVGRVAAEKQIEQIAQVLDTVPNTHLAIIGDGPFRPNLEKIYNGRPVTFAGYLAGQDLSAAYSVADIFVFPSAIETFGLVVAEAMAAGLPVVTSDVGGIPELIETGQNGYIFLPNDIQQMIAYVQELADNPTQRKTIGEAARLTVQNLTWDAIMNDLIADYYRIIAEHKARPNS
jgi:glycosyltransferase involved in cell wall biosynthesis